jgi:hypothetical protein
MLQIRQQMNARHEREVQQMQSRMMQQFQQQQTEMHLQQHQHQLRQLQQATATAVQLLPPPPPLLPNVTQNTASATASGMRCILEPEASLSSQSADGASQV